MTKEERKEYNKKYYLEKQKNRPKKELTKEQIEKNRLNNKIWREKNKDKVKILNSKRKGKYKKINFTKEQKDRMAYIQKEWRKNNKDHINQRNKNYIKKRKETDPLFKLKCNIKRVINSSIKNKGYTKESRTHEILGCSYEDFKIHLESKFESWMNWDNYGNPKDGLYEPNKTWDIDHIKPISSFNTEKELLELNHYTNLQPLCSYQNRWIKSDNY